jgi:hypothetical protein
MKPLTEEQRRRAMQCTPEAIELIDAQAAVIERVALIASQSAGLIAEDIRRALAAAPASGSPEHTAPDPVRARIDEYHGAPEHTGPDYWKLADERLTKLAAANARVAELVAEIEAMRVADPQELAAQLIECKAQLAAVLQMADEESSAATARVAESREDFAAANRECHRLNARVAEVERMVNDWERRLSAANVRADAAEQRANDADELAAVYLDEGRERWERAESERDEWKGKAEAAERNLEQSTPAQYWKAKCEAAEQDLTTVRTVHAERRRYFAERVGNAESEAAALRAKLLDREAKFVDQHAEIVSLRAEVEHLRGEHLHPCGAREAELLGLRAEMERATEQAVLFRVEGERLESRLSTATELLRRIKPSGHYISIYLFREIERYLSTAPAPTDCEKAERAVLALSGEIPESWLRMVVNSSQITRGLAPFAAAELARRAVKP